MLNIGSKNGRETAHSFDAAEQLTTAGSRSTGTDNVALQWESADHTDPASDAEHLPGAAGPGSTLPSSTPCSGAKPGLLLISESGT